MKFAFIHAEGAKLPTSLLCRAWRVARSGFYAWSKRPPSKRDVSDAKLVPVIRACDAQSRATYGSPRVHEDLQALDYRFSRKRVARLMRRGDLLGAASAKIAGHHRLEALAGDRPQRGRPRVPRGCSERGVGDGQTYS